MVAKYETLLRIRQSSQPLKPASFPEFKMLSARGTSPNSRAMTTKQKMPEGVGVGCGRGAKVVPEMSGGDGGDGGGGGGGGGGRPMQMTAMPDDQLPPNRLQVLARPPTQANLRQPPTSPTLKTWPSGQVQVPPH